jgi:AcrR family transcriptional regulator
MMKEIASTQFIPKTPSATRGPGKATLARILQAAGEVLQESGYEGLNTTAVAQRAGVSTATMYRHFPDKHAVLHALIVHEQTERAEAVGPFFSAMATAPDWRIPLAESTRNSWRLRRAQPGAYSARRALQMSPALWKWDQEQNESIATGLATAMCQRNPKLSRARARLAALVSVQTVVALLDLACLDPRRGSAIIEEAITLRAAYLSPYLDK